MKINWLNIKESFEALVVCQDDSLRPTLILLSEIYGINDHIKQTAIKYAKQGYRVFVPDMFWRQEPKFDGSYNSADFKRGLEIISTTSPKDIITDLQDAYNKIKSQQNNSVIGVIGYCMGGSLAFRMACYLDVNIAICYYGGHIVKSLDKINDIKADLILHFAEFDEYIPLSDLDLIKKALEQKTNCSIFYYPKAEHGFNCDQRQSYDSISANLAYKRSLEALKHSIGPKNDLNVLWNNFEKIALNSNNLNTIDSLITSDAKASLLIDFDDKKEVNLSVLDFYRLFNKEYLPDNFKVDLLDRTITGNLLIEDMNISFDHTIKMKVFLAKYEPTHKKIEFNSKVYCEFEDDKVNNIKMIYDSHTIASCLKN